MKRVYVITYDLNAPGQNYDALYDEIKSLGAWAHPMDSTWFVQTNLKATSIFDRLKKHLDSNDVIFISRVTEDYAAKLSSDMIDWLRKAIAAYA